MNQLKRRVSLLLGGALMMAGASQGAVKIGDLYYDLEGDQATVTYQSYQSSPDYDGLTRVQIPSTIDYEGTTYKVTAVGEYAFYRCSNLTTLIVPSSISSIGGWSFYYCNQLNSVRIASAVTSIGEYAFAQCKSLTSISLPSSLNTLGRAAFYYTGLTSVNIPEGVSILPNQVFGFCTNLESVTLPAGLTSIGDNCFYQCNTLKSIELPESLESLGISSFEMCYGLTELIIPEGTKTIANYCFNDCKNLTEVTFPSTIESIGENSFAYTGLSDVYCYATDVPEIWEDTFYDSYTATLHVAESCTEEYSENEYWKQFENIVGDLDDSSTTEPEPGETPSEGNIYELVTGIDELEPDCHYVIAATVSDTEMYTMSNDLSDRNKQIQTTEVNIKGSYLTANEQTMIFNLTKESEDDMDYWYWNILDNTDGLGLSVYNSNYLNTTSTPGRTLVSFLEGNIVKINFPDSSASANNLIVLRGGVFRFMSEGNLTNGAGYGVKLYKYHPDIDTAVGSITFESDTNEVEYYNLQGVRVQNPSNGIFIRRQGSKTNKVIL